jgi:hypothetical protein
MPKLGHFLSRWKYDFPLPRRDSISRTKTLLAETIPLDHAARAFILSSIFVCRDLYHRAAEQGVVDFANFGNETYNLWTLEYIS